MRKADYTLLADVIYSERMKLALGDAFTLEVANARTEALNAVAHKFAANASVNKTEFLKACGIE